MTMCACSTASAHSLENVGRTEIRTLNIELKRD
jgi:hypothetical protein